MALERKSDRFDLRVSSRQSMLIKKAAETAGRSYTDFILESATDRALDVLADQRLFLLDDAGWERFNEALNAPPKPVEALVDLFRRQPAERPATKRPAAAAQ